MIVWGGVDVDFAALNTGGRYDPFTNTWAATSTGTGVPSGRTRHLAVWTGNEMIVWSGVPIASTGGLYCAAARCTGSSLVCDDDNACTADSCDIGTGLCVNTPEPEGTPCDDGNACTGSYGSYDSCDGSGSCIGGAPAVIDDANACTTDSCDPKTGAVFVPIECDDGDFCNGIEDCDPTTGCVPGTPEPEGTLCDDGNGCTGSYGSYDSCDGAGTCIGGDPVNVSDGNECTIDSCDPETGAVNTPIECDDGNACNGVETCDPATGCVAGVPLNCDDGNPCTVDSCDASTGLCLQTPEPEYTPCFDANVCNGYETCNAFGVCVPGAPLHCGDGNPCNGPETCHPETGRVAGTPVVCARLRVPVGSQESATPTRGTAPMRNQPDGTTCDDGNAATAPDSCQNGVGVGESACTSTHNPRTVGWWKDICHHGGSHHGESITNADAACVGSMSQTFAGITTVNQVCAVFDNNHSEGTSSKCEKAERDLMALALNICKERVCCSDGIESHCDQSGDEAFLTFAHNNHGDDDDDDGNHDGDDDDDDDHSGEKSTVCESFDTADGLLADPSRTDNECKQANCLLEGDQQRSRARIRDTGGASRERKREAGLAVAGPERRHGRALELQDLETPKPIDGTVHPDR